MIIKTKKVYYCEYCKKHSLRSLEKHEKHCTKNPNRECRLCERTESLILIIQHYKEKITFNKYGYIYPGLSGIRDEVDDCPICILTILRCAGLIYDDFDYKKELQDWWDKRNLEQDEWDAIYG